ncbi:MAG: ACP S-malonyltransferase [Anaplasmataceae bacterium]|nr:ACP S-malonyltransferase [Anaplasmataceae bacterium]
MIVVFSGQGSQFVGMGKDLIDKYPLTMDIFEQANNILDRDLSSIFLNGPEELLNNTVNTQLSIAIMSIALFKVIEEKDPNFIKHIKLMAGHSLGEYTALHLAGVLSFRDTVLLLDARSKAMAKCSQGNMIVLLRTNIDDVSNLISHYDNCVVANDNGNGQFVISGLQNELDDMIQEKEKYNIKLHKKIPVSGAFHSPLMNNAAIELEEYIKNNEIKFNKNSIPLLSNYTANLIDDHNAIPNLLIKQLTNTVRWRETMEYFNAHHTEEIKFIEIGPGKVLLNLAKRSLNNNFILLDSQSMI